MKDNEKNSKEKKKDFLRILKHSIIGLAVAIVLMYLVARFISVDIALLPIRYFYIVIPALIILDYAWIFIKKKNEKKK